MEISAVSSKAYTSAAVSVDDEEKVREIREQNADEKTKEYGVATKENKEKDAAEFNTSEFNEADIEDKVSNYLKNIMFTTNLTDESKTALQNYLNTFDVAQFIKNYGPFTSTAEISAALYQATRNMIKQQE